VGRSVVPEAIEPVAKWPEVLAVWSRLRHDVGVAFTHRGGDRTKQFLLPPSLDEWLPQDHLARFVVGVVDQLDLSAFARPHRADGRGRRSYDPKMLVALVLVAWCEGERSSRRIERRCIDYVPFRWVTGNEAPDHTTISRFIKDRARAIDGLFVQVLALALAAGLGRVGVVAIDGTKVGADASPLKSFNRRRLQEKAQRIREEHEANDAADDEAFGQRRGDELPSDLADPASRAGRIAEALRQLEEEDAAAAAAHEARMAERRGKGGRKPKPPAPTGRKANITDPDCRTMKGPRGFGPSYNAQAAVTADQIVVAAALTQDRADNAQFGPMAEAVCDQLDDLGVDRPDHLVADAGYWHPDIFDTDSEGPEVLVPPAPNKTRNKIATRGPIPAGATLTQRMERKLATKAAKAIYKIRAITVEPVFGQIKGSRGITRFRRRGLDAVTSEWRLIATTHNLLKMWRHGVRYA
jgi:transposase